MTAISIANPSLQFSVNSSTGTWNSLLGGKTKRSWLSHEESPGTGLPFVGASAISKGTHVPVSYKKVGESKLQGVSKRGGIRISITLEDDSVCCTCSMPDKRGPRSGWSLNLDHLDMGGGTIQEQVMPVSIATAENLDWAYLIWQRSPDDFLITAIDGLSAGWRIDYSYGGHRMTGFELLARADDVICPTNRFPSGRLPAVTQLKVRLAFADSRQNALEKAIRLLGLAILQPDTTACTADNEVHFQAFGEIDSVKQLMPGGNSASIDPTVRTSKLTQPGQHQFVVKSVTGREHLTRILAWGDWKIPADRAVHFHRDHFQHECGAFSRIIRSATLKPDGRQVAGYHFGDPEQPGSCNPGEFGGFCCWAMILHQQVFGKHPDLEKSIQRYFDWALNRGREDAPRPGTVSIGPHEFGGRTHAPYHLFEQICYCQYETWLIRQMSDAVRSGDTSLAGHLARLCLHFIEDHTDNEGVIYNQGWAGESDVDYSSVDCPLVHLIHAANTLSQLGDEHAGKLLEFCHKNAAHLYRRGFDFPTEGEPCTEDGSIACQAWGLAYAYNNLPSKNPEWIRLASELMDFHSKLELFGTDIRTDGSSLRFWESMYESDNYGPSINAGHAWTMWSACARWELFLATSGYGHLEQAWHHTLCAAHTFDDRGASFPCYTPDIIPAPMHDDSWGDPEKKHEGRHTTASLGWGYPDTVSASGMFVFIVAAQTWYHACGFSPLSGRAINARLSGDKLVPATPVPCTRIALSSFPNTTLAISNLCKDTLITLSIDEAPASEMPISGCSGLVKTGQKTWQLRAPNGTIQLNG